MKYIKGLDTLRAFAVFLVIVTHWGPHTIHASKVLTFALTRLLPDGLFGVDLFFVLSGFLITSILIQARTAASPGNRIQIVKAFYIRRALRIFPIYFMLLGLMYLLGDTYLKNNLIYFLTYTSNLWVFHSKSWQSLSHTWSLAVEEQFYLIWPWVIIFSPKKYLASISAACFLIGFSSSILFAHLYGHFFYVLALPCLTAFSVGSFYASVKLETTVHPKVKIAFQLLLLVAIPFFLLYQFGYQFAFNRAVNAVIAINLVMYVAEQKYGMIASFVLNNNFLAGIGKISYGIYLYHYVFPGIYYGGLDYLDQQWHFNAYIMHILRNPPGAYLVQLILVLGISWASYHFFELQVIRLKRRFKYIRHSAIEQESGNG